MDKGYYGNYFTRKKILNEGVYFIKRSNFWIVRIKKGKLIRTIKSFKTEPEAITFYNKMK